MNKSIFKLSIPSLIFLWSCNSNSVNTMDNQTPLNVTGPKVNNLAGKVYFFAPDFDSTTCKAEGACDCCSSHILFLDKKNFIDISYCESDEQIFKGTYDIDNDKVYLQFDKIEVDLVYSPQSDNDTIDSKKNGFVLKLVDYKGYKSVLKSMSCKKNICFTAGNNEEIEYGSLDQKTSLDSEIKRLKDDGIWDKLFKNYR